MGISQLRTVIQAPNPYVARHLDCRYYGVLLPDALPTALRAPAAADGDGAASVATANAMGEEALRCLERAGLRDAKSGAVDLDVTDQKVCVRGAVRCLMARQSTSSRAHHAH